MGMLRTVCKRLCLSISLLPLIPNAVTAVRGAETTDVLQAMNHSKTEEATTMNTEERTDILLVQATDLHYIASSLTDHGAYFERVTAAGDGKVMRYSEETVDAFIEEMLALQPDAVILSGDLSFNGAKESHMMLSGKLRSLSEAGLPVLIIPGNHDIAYSQAARFSGDGFTRVPSVTEEEFEELYRGLDLDTVISRDSASLSLTAQISAGLRILLVDANTLKDPGSVSEKTLAWIEEQLIEADLSGAKIISVTHQPLLEHNSLFSTGFQIKNADELLNLYQKYPVVCNISGHMHLQHTALLSGLTDITTGALSVTPNQYGVIKMNEENSFLTYETKPLSIETWASEHQSEDENLLNFTAYARSYFWDTSYQKGLKAAQNDQAPVELAEYFANLNTAYFTGSMDSAEWIEELSVRWLQADVLTGSYIRSLKDEIGTNHNRVSLTIQ